MDVPRQRATRREHRAPPPEGTHPIRRRLLSAWRLARLRRRPLGRARRRRWTINCTPGHCMARSRRRVRLRPGSGIGKSRANPRRRKRISMQHPGLRRDSARSIEVRFDRQTRFRRRARQLALRRRDTVSPDDVSGGCIEDPRVPQGNRAVRIRQGHARRREERAGDNRQDQGFHEAPPPCPLPMRAVKAITRSREPAPRLCTSLRCGSLHRRIGVSQRDAAP